ncbi:MAG: microcin C transport system permease protein [Candidatus Endobugula sp.]|jgi:microcin C transport system permease protein
MIVSYAQFDFGDSFFRNDSVINIISEKMFVTISLGLWSTLLIYLISIPAGIYKAVNHGSRFDIASSFAVVIANAIPSFLLGILLIIIFAGGNFLDWFPLRGLTSVDFESMSLLEKIKDYFWHLALPLTAYTLGGFATLTMLTKNSFLDEINKQYVTTAKAKGLSEKQVLYDHVFRNAMLIVVSSFPAAFLSIFITGSLLIEVVFSLDGLGLLGFESILKRDYPVIFGTLFIFTLLSLIIKIVSDIVYVLIDPRIGFEAR